MPSDDPLFLSHLGSRLRTLRARAGMARRRLADQSGVSERYIAQMEAGEGNASVLVLRALAAALGVTTTELLDEQGERPADALLLRGLLDRLGPEQLADARRMLTERFGASSDRLRRVALIGLRGAGKSSLGRALAGRRGAAFIELDQEIEREAGASLSAIFELHGQPGFRRLERVVLNRLIGSPGQIVLAAGGSIVADPATFDLLLSHCLTVWIRATAEEHMARVVAQGDLRPMADSPAAMDDLRTILASREALYAKADLMLDTSGSSFDESLDSLCALVAQATHA